MIEGQTISHQRGGSNDPLKMALENGGVDAAGEAEIVRVDDQSFRFRNPLGPTRNFKSNSAKFSRIDDEFPVKVFNRTVENFVEKSPWKMKSSRIATRYSSLHRFCAAGLSTILAGAST
jgi:hypothetical protein